MSNINCPYCDEEIEFDWEGEDLLQLDCSACEKAFEVQVTQTVEFNSYKDCTVNNKLHQFIKTVLNPGTSYHYICSECEYSTVELIKHPEPHLHSQIVEDKT